MDYVDKDKMMRLRKMIKDITVERRNLLIDQRALRKQLNDIKGRDVSSSEGEQRGK
jgi:hypothetical protein